RQHERCRLTGSGLLDAQDVSAREYVGDRLFLDRSGGRVAGRLGGCENLVGQAELGKGHKASMKDRPEPRRITKMTVMRGRTVESTFVPLRREHRGEPPKVNASGCFKLSQCLGFQANFIMSASRRVRCMARPRF